MWACFERNMGGTLDGKSDMRRWLLQQAGVQVSHLASGCIGQFRSRCNRGTDENILKIHNSHIRRHMSPELMKYAVLPFHLCTYGQVKVRM